MMTATIMSAIAATGVAPVATSGTTEAVSDTSEQPFGTLVNAAQTAGAAEGKATMPGVSGSPASLLPVSGPLAGTLVLPGVPSLNVEGQGGLAPVVGDPGGKVTVHLDQAIDSMPADAAGGVQEKGAPASPAAVALAEGSIRNALVATQSAIPGDQVAEGDKAEELKSSPPGEGADGKFSQISPEQPLPIATPLQQQASLHATMAHHLSRTEAMPLEQAPGEMLQSESDGEAANTVTRQVADANSSPDRVASRSAGTDAELLSTANSRAMTVGGEPSGMSFGQALMPVAARASSHIYGGALAGTAHADPVVSAEAGQMGQNMGVAIARGVEAGRDALLVRLDPAEMGRVHVRLSFDNDGAVRVMMSADSAVALDMLRREAGDLGRALNDAGVRSDSQSFRFEGGGNASQQRGGGGQQQPGNSSPGDPQFSGTDVPLDPSASYRDLRSAGGLNLII